MKKIKLSCEQEKALQGKEITEIIEILVQWYNQKLITIEQLRYQSNRTLKKFCKKNGMMPREPKFSGTVKTIVQKDNMILARKIDSILKKAIAVKDFSLNTEEQNAVIMVLSRCRHQTDVYFDILINSFRFSEKNLNDFSETVVRSNHMNSEKFWSLVWMDPNIVTNNLIRMSFDIPKEIKDFIAPWIELQLKKEKMRLKIAEAVIDNEASVKRKNQRIAWMEQLLS